MRLVQAALERPQTRPSSQRKRETLPGATRTETFEPPTPTSQTFEAIDRALHVAVGRLTQGISPIVLARAYVDLLVHLGLSPGKQAQLIDKAARKALRFATYAARAAREPDTLPASSRCRRTIASSIRPGGNRRST